MGIITPIDFSIADLEEFTRQVTRCLGREPTQYEIADFLIKCLSVFYQAHGLHWEASTSSFIAWVSWLTAYELIDVIASKIHFWVL